MEGKEDEDEVKEEGEGEARVGTVSGNDGRGISNGEVDGDACKVINKGNGDGEVNGGNGDGEVAIGAPTAALDFR